MKFKWLYLIFAVLITPLAVFSQAQKRSVYPGDFMPPGILIQKPIHYYKVNRNVDVPSYGYSFNPDFPDACNEMCFHPGTKITFSGHKDIRMPDGRKLRSGYVKTITTPDGQTKDVSEEMITVPVGVVNMEGIFFWAKEKEFTPSLPAGSFHANYNENKINWITPVEESTNGGVCKDCATEENTGPLNMLKRVIVYAKDKLTFNDEPDTSSSIKGLNPPKRFDEYFTYHAKKDSQDFQESMRNYNEYKKYIMAAAQAFNLPPDMMFCLKHRESRETQAYSIGADGRLKAPTHRRDRDGNAVKNKNGRVLPPVRSVDWFPRAVSSTGAIGLGQLLPGTAFDLVTRIPDNNPRYRTSYQKYLDFIGKKHPRKYRINDPLDYRKNQQSGTAYSRYRRFLQKSNRELPYEFGNKDILDRNALETCDDRCNPEVSIGLSAMYMRYLLDNYGSKKENRRMSMDYKTFIAGGYNQGPGNLMKHIDSDTTSRHWRNSLATKNAEVRGHMNSIEKCMKTLNGDLPIIPRSAGAAK